MKFQLLIKAKILKNKTFFDSKLSDVVLIMLINVKMPTIVGIFTFMSMIDFRIRFLNSVGMKVTFYGQVTSVHTSVRVIFELDIFHCSYTTMAFWVSTLIPVLR